MLGTSFSWLVPLHFVVWAKYKPSVRNRAQFNLDFVNNCWWFYLHCYYHSATDSLGKFFLCTNYERSECNVCWSSPHGSGDHDWVELIISSSACVFKQLYLLVWDLFISTNHADIFLFVLLPVFENESTLSKMHNFKIRRKTSLPRACGASVQPSAKYTTFIWAFGVGPQLFYHIQFFRACCWQCANCALRCEPCPVGFALMIVSAFFLH